MSQEPAEAHIKTADVGGRGTGGAAGLLSLFDYNEYGVVDATAIAPTKKIRRGLPVRPTTAVRQPIQYGQRVGSPDLYFLRRTPQRRTARTRW